MQNTKRRSERLQDQWEHAVERAAQDITSLPELDSQDLNLAAGLYVASGIAAGKDGWGHTNMTCACTNSCSGCG